MKEFVSYVFVCPACKKSMQRSVPKGRKTHKSYCERAGKDVVMKRLEDF